MSSIGTENRLKESRLADLPSCRSMTACLNELTIRIAVSNRIEVRATHADPAKTAVFKARNVCQIGFNLSGTPASRGLFQFSVPMLLTPLAERHRACRPPWVPSPGRPGSHRVSVPVVATCFYQGIGIRFRSSPPTFGSIDSIASRIYDRLMTWFVSRSNLVIRPTAVWAFGP